VFHWFPHVVNNLTCYDLVSGWIPCAAMLGGLATWWRRWNCGQRRCLRHGHPHPEHHGRTVCHHHYVQSLLDLRVARLHGIA
jgi:hypothetical protein